MCKVVNILFTRSNKGKVMRLKMPPFEVWYFMVILFLAAAFSGCQNPRTSYMNGVVVWVSSSAVGFGFGEYIEVPAGGELYRSVTNSAPCVWSDGTAYSSGSISIRNERTMETPEGTNRKEAADADKTEMD